MNTNSVNNETISMDYISSEQRPRVRNQYDENSTNSNEIPNRIGSMNKSRFPSVCSSWLTRRTLIIVGTFILLVIAIIIVVPVAVSLTRSTIKKGSGSSSGSGSPHELRPKLMVLNSIIKDPHPHAVAIGDFNNDGLPDVVVPNSGADNIAIFLRQVNMTLTNSIIYSTGSNSTPFAVAVADFNDDHQLDVVVGNYGTDTIGIFLGIGDGTFKPQITFSTGSSHPRSIAVADFNNDARTDIAVVYYGTDAIGVFLQDTNGNFVNGVTFSTGYDSDPYALVVGDLNNDQKHDIVVANYGTDNIVIFLGYGNGTFAMQIVTTGVHSHPSAIAVSDFNNDSYSDIVVICSGMNEVGVLLGYGNGTLATPTMFSIGNNSIPRSITIADFDNDHNVDIAVANYGSDSIIVLLGDGNGSFSNPNTVFFTRSNLKPYSIATADFNGDKRSDIVVVSYDFNCVDIIMNFQTFSSDSHTPYIIGLLEGVYQTGPSPHLRAIALADFNGDNRLDIIMANYISNNLEILLQGTNSTFPTQQILSTGVYSLPTSIAVGDFNNDSEMDITVANSGSENVGIFYGYGNGSFTSQTTFYTGLSSIPQSAVVGDFNSDKKPDIVVTDSGTGSVMTLLRSDLGAVGNQKLYSTGIDSMPMSVAVGDLNNDGWFDFVVVNGGSDNIGIFLGFGNGTFSSQTTYSTGIRSSPRCVAVADLNKDSYLDIIVCNSLSDTIGILLGFGDGMFTDQLIYSTGDGSTPIAIAIDDLNNDSQLDIVVANYNSGTIGLFLGNNNGTFSSMITYATGSGSKPCSIAIRDFNNDNRSDIVVANIETGNLGIFIGSGSGTFSDMIIYSTGSGSAPMSIVVGDFNHDHRLDVAVANFGTDSIGVLFGNGDGTLSNLTTYSLGDGSKPSFVVVGDLNNDNQLDIIVANYGSNSFSILLGFIDGTFFSPSNYFIAHDSQPKYITVGKFNNDNRMDIIVANSGTNSVGVFLGYASESFLFAPSFSPGILSQPTSIAVGDFDNDTRLDIVVANNGTDNLMVLFGSGYGTFVRQMSYSTGSNSNPSSVAVGDLNNDRRLDIVVANSGTNIIGVFLGSGTGTFSSQMAYFTGHDSQPQSVAILDFNNDTRLDIAVANFGSNTMLVLFGDGNGNFPTEVIFDTGFDSRPYAITVGDINNDNVSDIIATNDGHGNIDILYFQ